MSRWAYNGWAYNLFDFLRKKPHSVVNISQRTCIGLTLLIVVFLSFFWTGIPQGYIFLKILALKVEEIIIQDEGTILKSKRKGNSNKGPEFGRTTFTLRTAYFNERFLVIIKHIHLFTAFASHYL